MNTFQIIYLSRVAFQIEEAELEEILTHARKYNAEHEITGLLLHKNGLFLQVLEGEKNIVEALFNKIKSDNRHFGVINLHEHTISKREFGNWSMRFLNLGNALKDGSEFDLSEIKHNLSPSSITLKLIDYYLTQI